MPDSITEDLKAQNAAQPAASTATVNPYDYNSRINEINNMYDSYANAQKTNLQAAYNQNLNNLEANRAKIAQQYQQQRNANAVNFERTRRNFNQQAMMNGLNTGAGSQANLALNNQYQNSAAAIGAAEAGANTELERSIADLKVKYEADVNEAIAKNDYNRAASLLDEYNNAYSQAMTRAQTLAQYGDFSGYSDLYGADAARQMSATWEIQNPLLAYNLGRIDAARYQQITGAYPPGYSTGSSGGGGRSYSGYSRSLGPLKEPPAAEPPITADDLGINRVIDARNLGSLKRYEDGDETPANGSSIIDNAIRANRASSEVARGNARNNYYANQNANQTNQADPRLSRGLTWLYGDSAADHLR